METKMKSILDILNIEVDEDGSRGHVCESGHKHGNYYEYAVGMERISIEDDNAYEWAVDEGLVEDDLNPGDRPEIYVWVLDDPHTREYAATEEKALEIFESMLDIYYEDQINELGENLKDASGSYTWMTEGVDDVSAFDEESLKSAAMVYLNEIKDIVPAASAYIWREYAARYPSLVKIIVFQAKGEDYASQILTSRQVEAEFDLKPGTVRSYIRYKPARIGTDFVKLDGRTWGMSRNTAFWIWGRK